MRQAAALPVLMYHSVAPAGALAPHGWLERISTDLDRMEATFKVWRRRGIQTVTSDDLRSYLHGAALPGRSVLLTFDDGYLDNWVALTPLLKKYRQHAIVFVSTEFIDPRPVTRPTLEETGVSLEWQGYLSRPEIKAMAASGCVEMQSHAASHTWEFTSPRIIDFYGPHWNIQHPRCRYRFLWLNSHRDLKPFALKHLNRHAVPWGTPIYEYAPALVARRYSPDPDLSQGLVERVSEAGGEAFFKQPDWRQRLLRQVEDHRSRHGEKGSLESVASRRERILAEMGGSRDTLEAITGRAVRFFSPPQGGTDQETLEWARECGYDLITSPSAGGIRLNRCGNGSGWVHRCGTGYDLFGRDAGLDLALLSQRIVLARCGGRWPATLVTKTVGAWRRFVAPGKRSTGR